MGPSSWITRSPSASRRARAAGAQIMSSVRGWGSTRMTGIDADGDRCETAATMPSGDAQYLLPAGATMASFAGVLTERAGAVAGSASAVRRTYLDTFDGRLRRKG